MIYKITNFSIYRNLAYFPQFNKASRYWNNEDLVFNKNYPLMFLFLKLLSPDSNNDVMITKSVTDRTAQKHGNVFLKIIFFNTLSKFKMGSAICTN